MRGGAGGEPRGFARMRSATRRAIAGAGSSQSTGQGAFALKRSVSSG